MGPFGKLHKKLRLCALFLLAGLAFVPPPQAAAQGTRLPTADEVKVLKSRYEAERDALVKKGFDKRFLPVLVEKSDEMAKKAQVALEAGRLLQATELFRQARWQLPYESKSVPDQHVARVLGNLRLRHGQEINDLAFSPDGKLLATGSRDRTVKVWDLENGHELLSYTEHTASVRAVAFSPDGTKIASAGAESDIHIWEPRSGKKLKVLKGEGSYVTDLVFAREGKYLFASQAGDSGKKATLTAYDVDSGAVKRSIADFPLLVHSVAFNHDGSILGVGVGDGMMRMWEYPKMVDIPTHPEFWSLQDLTGATYQFLFSPDNRTMVRIGADGVKFYAMVLPGSPGGATTPRKTIMGLMAPHHYSCAAFSKDSKTLFTGATDGVIRIFDADTGEEKGVFKGHNAEIRALAFNPGGTQLASCSADFTVRLWDFDIVLQSRDFTVHDGPVWTAFFSGDGRSLLTASADKTAKVIDVASGEMIHHLKGHSSPVTFALFSPNGKYIATGSGDKLVKIWDANSGKFLKDLAGHTGTITSLDFASDNVRLVSGAADKTVRVWDVEAGKELVAITDNKAVVAGVAFSPSGKQIAVANVDTTIKLYEAGSGKLEHSWNAHAIAVTGVAYSANGLLLASCGADNLVRV
jgi:WD40 repeat protein